jgi:hypothetical protein
LAEVSTPQYERVDGVDLLDCPAVSTVPLKYADEERIGLILFVGVPAPFVRRLLRTEILAIGLDLLRGRRKPWWLRNKTYIATTST